MSANGISTLATKELRQKAKLDLASQNRLADGNSRPYYDITELPTQYSGNNVVDNPNEGGLVIGRPWISTPPAGHYIWHWSAVSGVSGTWGNHIVDSEDGTLPNGAVAMNTQGTVTFDSVQYPSGSMYYAATIGSGDIIYTADLVAGYRGASWLGSNKTGISVELWFYPTAFGVQLMVEHGASGLGSAWHDSFLEIDSDGKIRANLWNYNTPALVTSSKAQLNKWNHVILTYDATTQIASLQINNHTAVTQTRTSTWDSGADAAGGLTFSIGTNDVTKIVNTGAFQGMISKVYIANYVMASHYDTDASILVYPISYNFGTIPASINEGTAGTFNVNTTGLEDGTTLYWTIETNAGDFGTTSGSFTITSDTGSFSVTPTADSTTEGAESFTVAVRTGSTSGTVVLTSAAKTINDTSTTPTGLTIDWYGATYHMTPTGTYTQNADNVVLSNNAYVNMGQNLQGTTFTVTVDANFSTASGTYWNVIWGNDNFGTSSGYLAYWAGFNNIQLGSWSDALAVSGVPSAVTDARRLYHFVVTPTSYTLYINGVYKGAKTSGVSAHTIPTNNFLIGSRHSNAGAVTATDAHGGTYYSVKVESTALDQTAVTAAYTAWGH